jgi:rubrerythrin
VTVENERGESVPLNWACTNCGYSVEGELPGKCPECGADREEFVTPDATTPVLTLTSVYAMSK